jgi:hypothetical protein
MDMKIMFASFIAITTNIATGSTVLGSRTNLLSFQSFVYSAFLHVERPKIGRATW